jgi:hypothetical protein
MLVVVIIAAVLFAFGLALVYFIYFRKRAHSNCNNWNAGEYRESQCQWFDQEFKHYDFETQRKKFARYKVNYPDLVDNVSQLELQFKEFERVFRIVETACCQRESITARTNYRILIEKQKEFYISERALENLINPKSRVSEK